MSFKDIALPLIERGIKVIPVQPGEKRCLLPSWPQMATTDTVRVEAWDLENPHYNVGAVGTPDTIVILDCDVVGLREKIEKETGRRFSRTLVVRSAGKGAEHIYLRQTDRSRALGNRSSMGLYDLQSNNKYVVGPGSKLGSGGTYDVIDDSPLADFPDWLGDWIESSSVREARTAGEDGDEIGAPVHEDFDFELFCEEFDLHFINEKAGKHIFERCPYKGDYHTSDGHPDYQATVLFFDGQRIGFSCLATTCEGHGKTIGDLVKFLSGKHGPYDGPVFAEDDIEDQLEDFGAEMADVRDEDVVSEQEDEACDYCRKDVEAEEPRAAESGAAAEPEPAPEPRREDNSHVLAEGRIDDTVYSLVTVRADRVRTEKLEWLWPERIPLGKITYFSGKPDCGKSVTLTDVVARVSSGREFPDAPNPWGERKVLLGVSEDGLGDTVVPRLLAAGAKLKNIELLQLVRVTKTASKKQRQFAFKSDMKLLRHALRKNPGIMLVALDPITGYWGADSNKDKEVRPIVDELSKICDEQRATLIAVMHQNKRSDVSAVQKVLGASSVAGSARTVWGFSRDPEDRELCHMSLVKNNLSAKRTGLDYRLMSKKVDVAGEMIAHATVEWLGENELNADDLAAKEKEIAKDGGRQKEKDKAAEFLVARFAELPGWQCVALYGDAEAEGISVDALKRAKPGLRIVSKRAGGHWWWVLESRMAEWLRGEDVANAAAVAADSEAL
jgi:AAA domain/Bifunctional DNA primase/polymerase, N-terminal